MKHDLFGEVFEYEQRITARKRFWFGFLVGALTMIAIEALVFWYLR